MSSQTVLDQLLFLRNTQCVQNGLDRVRAAFVDTDLDEGVLDQLQDYNSLLS